MLYEVITIIIALNNDINALAIKEPKQKSVNKYPLPRWMPGFPGVPMKFYIQNLGVSTITEYTAECHIYGSNGVEVDS